MTAESSSSAIDSERLAGLAQSHGLPTLASALRAQPLAGGVTTPRFGEEGVELTPRLIRRGAAPDLIAEVLERFADRPLERGLAAWDMLRSAIVSTEQRALLVAAVRPVLPLVETLARGQTIAHGHAWQAPFERFVRGGSQRWLGSTAEMLDGGVAELDVAALWCERTRLTTGTRQRLLVRARELDRCHLPTLAQLHSRLLFLLGEASGALEWAESALDDGAFAVAREVADHTDAALPRGYVEARIALANLSLDAAATLIANLDERSPHGVVVRAELDAKRGTASIERPRLDALVDKHPEWRYLQRVAVAHRALDSDVRPSLNTFLDRFGNDGELWMDLLRIGSPEVVWFDDVLARLVGELGALPHLRVLWTIVAALLDGEGADAVSREVDQRFADQLRG